jgi:hypothetical protein
MYKAIVASCESDCCEWDTEDGLMNCDNKKCKILPLLLEALEVLKRRRNR